MWGTRNLAAANLWLLSAVLGSILGMTVQAEIYFKTELRPYYYVKLNQVLVIECHAVRVDDTGNDTLISATLYRNSQLLDPYLLPERHQAISLAREVVLGVIVSPVVRADTGVRYQCGVDGGGGMVMRSMETTVLVGDGPPFPPSVVTLLDQGLYSVLLGWNEALSPLDSPTHDYQLTVAELGTSKVRTVKVEGNVTMTEVSQLRPNTTYNVTVYGLNAYGLGMPSQSEVVMTLVPEVPPAPSKVSVTVDIGNSSATLAVTCAPVSIDPEVMTPVQHYIVFYGAPGSAQPLSSVSTPDKIVSGHTITGITQGGKLLVGVAAENSAGLSEVTYYSQPVEVGCPLLTAPPGGEVVQTGLALGSVASYSCHAGHQLNSNLHRHCMRNGSWSNAQPVCQATPSKQSNRSAVGSMLIYLVVAAVVVVLIILIIILIVIIVVVTRRRNRMMQSTASLSFHKETKSIGVANHSFHDSPRSQISVDVYKHKSRVLDTPPPPDPVTFTSPSPTHTSDTTPPSLSPPSYSELEGLEAGERKGEGEGQRRREGEGEEERYTAAPQLQCAPGTNQLATATDHTHKVLTEVGHSVLGVFSSEPHTAVERAGPGLLTMGRLDSETGSLGTELELESDVNSTTVLRKESS